MPLADWKKDALKTLKREFNAIAAAMKLKTISGNPSHKACAAMQKKLLQKQQSPATLQRINDAWAAYTRCLAGDHAGAVGGGRAAVWPWATYIRNAQRAVSTKGELEKWIRECRNAGLRNQLLKQD